MALQSVAVNNVPVGTIAEFLTDFLIRHTFAISTSGDALINSRGMELKNAGSLHNFMKKVKKQHDYVIIDDDELNNLICTNVINNVNSITEIKAFTDPNIGLRYIQENYRTTQANNVIMLLDINMPTLLGWEVLEEFKNFSDVTKSHFKIFMLTSSANRKDKERALSNPLLWGYIEKPLTKEKVVSILINDDPFCQTELPYNLR